MANVELSRKRLTAFVSPQVPLAALGLPLVVNLPPYYATEMGLGLVAVSQAFFLARVWDTALDPAFGYVSDKFNFRLGRRRPWMLLGGVIMMVMIDRLFLPEQGVTARDLFINLFLFYVGWTFVTLSHLAWSSELSDDYHQRSRVQGWYQIAIVIGLASVLVLTSSVEQYGGGRADQVAAMGRYAMVLLPITILAASYFMGERPVPPRHHAIEPGAAWKSFLRNRPLRFVVAIDFMASFSAGLTGASFIFFAQHVLKLGQYSGVLLMIYFLTGIAGVPLWTQLAIRIGKHRCYMAACAYGTVLWPPLLLLPPGHFWYAAFAFGVLGVNYGAFALLARSMMSDVTDVDRLDTGQDRSGLFFALLSLTAKLGYAVPLIVFYPIYHAIGFDPSSSSNSPEALTGLTLIYVGVPLFLMTASVLLMRRYPIDEARQKELRRAIDERLMQAQAAPSE